MRLLYLNHNLYERGTFFRAFQLARRLVQRGHQVELWTAAPDVAPLGRRFEREGVAIWQPPRWIGPKRHDGGYAPLDLLCRMLATRSFRPERFDVIHAFDHRPNVSFPWYLLRDARGAARRPLLAADWCDWWTRGGITTGRRRFGVVDEWEAGLEEGHKRHADMVTVISRPLYERAVSVGVEEERLHLLPSGCDVEGIRVEDRVACRKRLGWPAERPLVCFVGLSLWDLGLVGETVAKLRESMPDVGLLVAGGGVEAEAIQTLSKRLGGEGLLLPGQVPYERLSEHLGAADLHLLPLESTPANRARLPNKLGDYMASGRPVVAGAVGDTAEIVERERVGLATASDGASMAAAALRILKDDSLRREMGARARRVAEEKRSWSAITDRLLAIYEERM